MRKKYTEHEREIRERERAERSKNHEIRKQLSQVKWHNRRFNFIDQETTPADYLNIVIDAVIKEFRATVNIPINKQHELGITLRSYLITKGKYPSIANLDTRSDDTVYIYFQI